MRSKKEHLTKSSLTGGAQTKYSDYCVPLNRLVRCSSDSVLISNLSRALRRYAPSIKTAAISSLSTLQIGDTVGIVRMVGGICVIELFLFLCLETKTTS